MKKLTHLLLGVTVMLFYFSTVSAAAQSSPLPLGTVSNVKSLNACPAGYPQGALCSQATVSCPGTANIQVTFGIREVAGSKGTIVLHNGTGGTTPLDSNFDQAYIQDAYSVAALAWATPWEDTGLAQKNVRTAACRPATLLNFILNQLAPPGAKCAQGFSGGTGAWGYALAAYGAGSYLDKVVLESGPVFSDFSQGCKVPKAANLQVCSPGQFGCEPGDTFSDSPSYVGKTVSFVGQVTGDLSCGGTAKTTSVSSARWKAQSIVDGTMNSSFSYPQTSLAGWICDNGLNNSAAQGDIFYQQFTNASQTASFRVTPIKNCSGAEGVTAGQTPTGENGFVAIVSDMTDPINGCVQHAR
jgi:hypothetical protein